MVRIGASSSNEEMIDLVRDSSTKFMSVEFCELEGRGGGR